MDYLFCTIVDVALAACVAFLGWCILQGASVWLLVPMLSLSCFFILSSEQLFTCPKCQHTTLVKTLTARNGVSGIVKTHPSGEMTGTELEEAEAQR